MFGLVEDDIVACFLHGGGVPYSDYWQVLEEFTQAYEAAGSEYGAVFKITRGQQSTPLPVEAAHWVRVGARRPERDSRQRSARLAVGNCRPRFRIARSDTCRAVWPPGR